MTFDDEATALLDYLYRYIDHMMRDQQTTGRLFLTRSELRRYARSWLVLLIRDTMAASGSSEHGPPAEQAP